MQLFKITRLCIRHNCAKGLSVKTEIKPGFFDVLKCLECESPEELQRNRYNDDIVCTHCLNRISNEINDDSDTFGEVTIAELKAGRI